MLKASTDVVTAFKDFKISKEFSEREQSFYNDQPVARAARVLCFILWT